LTICAIWAHYSAKLLDQYREQYGPADSHHTDDATDIRPRTTGVD
jgi:hypothetical protein